MLGAVFKMAWMESFASGLPHAVAKTMSQTCTSGQ